MNSNILFVTYGSDLNGQLSGIERKILNQFNSLKNLGHSVYLSGETKGSYVIYNTDYRVPYTNKFYRVKNRIDLLKKFIEENEINIVYIRYEHFSDNIFLGFMRYLKKNRIKVILEIPTYPYDNEYKFEISKRYLKFIIDKVYRKRLHKYTDKIVTFSEDKEIFNIPCINISNGINLEEIDLVRPKKHNGITFTSVSSCNFWHGIDRFLFSLEEYMKEHRNKDLKFNIVGEGPDTKKLQEIVNKSVYLHGIVHFLGFKSGGDLDDIYNETDIAIGSLGRHRSGLDTMRALKNREYAAKGLPMIFSEDDPDLRDTSFVYHVTPNEDLINISDIVRWFEKLEEQPEDIRRCSEQFTWQIQMKKVMNEIAN